MEVRESGAMRGLIGRGAVVRSMMTRQRVQLTIKLLRSFSFAGAIFLGMVGWAAPSWAEGLVRYSLDVLGRSVLLQVDKDYCRIEGADDLENALITVMERNLAPSNQLVALWMNCSGLSALRQGEGDELGRLFVVGITANPKTIKNLAKVPREKYVAAFYEKISSKAFLENVRGSLIQKATQKDIDAMLAGDVFGDLGEDYQDGFKRGLEEAREEMLAGEWGVFPLGRDDSAAYLGFSFPSEEDDGMAAVAASTLVKQLPLVFMALDMEPSRDVYKGLRDEVQGITNRAVAENET